MKKGILAGTLLITMLSGCAHVELGKYCEGQFQTHVNDANFIKLNTPEPDDYNPKLEDWARALRCNRWVKACEWHCYDDELGY
jgi:hypothetical protein